MKSTLQYIIIATLTCLFSTGCARTFTSAKTEQGEFSSAKLLAMADAFEAQGDQQKADQLHQAVQLRDPNRAFLTPFSTGPQAAPSSTNQLNYTSPQLAAQTVSKPSLPERHQQVGGYTAEQLDDNEELLWEDEILLEESEALETVAVATVTAEINDANEETLAENSVRLTDALFARFSPFNEAELTKLEAQENVEYAKIYHQTEPEVVTASHTEPVHTPQEPQHVELVSANHPTNVNRKYTASILDDEQPSDAISVPDRITNYDELESVEGTPSIFIKERIAARSTSQPQIQLAHFETESPTVETLPANSINKPEAKPTAELQKTSNQPHVEIDSLDFELPNVKR